MTFFAEIVRQIGLLLVGWTVVSVVAVWPVAWWMRRRAALNEGDLALVAGQPAGRSAASPSPVTRAR